MDTLAGTWGLLPLTGVLLFGKSLDVALLIIFTLIRKWDEARNITSLVNRTIVIALLTIPTSLFILLQVLRYVRDLQQSSSTCTEFPVKPMLFPSETAHVRLFPTTHGFKYSYLLVGIPIGWRGSVGGMISADVEEKEVSWYSRLLSLQPGNAWYRVNGDDYLKRGHVEGGLQGKLHQYLESEGIDPNKYAYVYLLTAARFLGYASNPVSIWHLYSSSKELTALILEVNNTFDEKRIYFLEPGQSLSESKDEVQPLRYTGTWPKDFYVSVFNSRNGSYSLSASDPLYPNMSRGGPINTTITLNNSSSHAKLVARVYSTSEALDPATMSVWAKTRFIASWWWVGLATFPRTVKEALTLLMTKGMPWVFRPEPRRETIARKADEMEQCIEGHFRRYLRERVESCDGDVVMRYVPAGLADADAEEEIMSSPSAQLSSGSEAVEIRVLTPLFYSRIVQYGSIAEALATESTLSATVALSSDLLTAFPFLSSAELKNSQPEFDFRTSILDILRLRPDPIPIPTKERTEVPAIPWSEQSDGKDKGTSLDAFVLSTASTEEKKVYFEGVLKLMLANRVAFGWLEILSLEIFSLRAVVAWGMAKVLL
ncbi:hypothetical protein IFR04_012013 [Cadophora malorum]|uniref:DUF1365-domain-containing protein n=1 Tax=Cadophora malorum TaxID=108018 RepID=A0A8H7T9D5_9HELO|nr:hypothetical protein IFR04_012013 [Cadophora malorum]